MGHEIQLTSNREIGKFYCISPNRKLIPINLKFIEHAMHVIKIARYIYILLFLLDCTIFC